MSERILVDKSVLEDASSLLEEYRDSVEEMGGDTSLHNHTLAGIALPHMR